MMRSLLALTLALTPALISCTKANPAYNGDDDGSVIVDGSVNDIVGTDDAPRADAVDDTGLADQPQQQDKGPTPDTLPPDILPPDILPPDVMPTPDLTPPVCKTDFDCNDGLYCTKDKCNKTANKCENQLQTGFCVINALCYKDAVAHPLNSCLVCDTSKSTSTWTTKPNGSACFPDKFSCTDDVCQGGACVHPVAANKCLIGTCFDSGDKNPANPCQLCNPSKSKGAWSSAPDKTPCPLDGKTCTADYCVSGVCTHPVTSGCLIGGVCRSAGWYDPKDPCYECIPSKATTSGTFVTGKACFNGTGVARMCLANACKGWIESTYEPPAAQKPTATTLTSVDYIPVAKQTWATGEYHSSASAGLKGLLTRIGATGTVAPVLTGAAMKDLHHRMAVGLNGTARYHDGSKWISSSALTSALKGHSRYGVWGAKIGPAETFYLSGYQSSGNAGIISCAVVGSTVNCVNNTGIASGAYMGSIFGSVTNLGLIGRLWSPRSNTPGSEPEDIYSNPGSSLAWSYSAPHGCHDAGSSPCSSTSGGFLRMNGSGAKDVWLVGQAGNLLHYDGSKWNRITNVFPSQSSYQLTAVFSSPKDKLVTVAGYRNFGSGRQVVLVNYNSELDRWFPASQVRWSAGDFTNELLDLGGQGYSALYAVGRRRVGSGSGTKVVGWILTLK